MKLSSGLKSFLILAIIAAMTAIVLVGFNVPGIKYTIGKAYDSIRYGIDISGGVSAVLSAPEGVTPTDDQLETVKGIIDTRLEGKQIYDKTVTVDKVNRRVLVEIPYKKGSESSDPYETIADIGATAMLSFREVDEDKIDPETGDYVMTDRIVLQGSEIESAVAETNPETQMAYVRLIFSDDGAKKFEEATERLVGKKIAIYLDDQMVSAPIVNGKITGKDKAVIELGAYDPQQSITQAKELAAIIRSGALPFKLEAKDVNHISPIVGENALNISIYAGAVAILLVWLFMLLYYRVPGLVADIALLGQAAAVILILVLSGMSLTLPGIAGMILTVGMSVDANVIIFERIKEEIKSGKTVQAAVDLGFDRAFTAILDGNLTTLITAVILYYFGTGAVRSFAITLGLGVILNFLTAIFATKIVLKSLAEIRALRKPWLFGAKGGTANV
ncbi:protein translocase subunit SecD [Acetivibrio mesophilus]|uniref:Protein translocase subunit SecD n=1 Tax=Acetivibrio mesophilus TaxID=2487273 RepID=A0A4Q0I5Y9_9FIRM|nr:protein translocase subunit SecD [Acetivibrio mesophilus]RXE59741.1 protein translocase subunit SecD [Acetivibrio mesophilus]